jgi:type II secretory pathway component PulJ
VTRGRRDMSDHDIRDPQDADETDHDGPPEVAPSGDAPEIVAWRPDAKRRARAPVVLPPPYWRQAADDRRDASRAAFPRRLVTAVAGLALAAVTLGAAAFVVVDHHRQAGLLSERAQENAELAQTVSALNSRLQAIETAKGRDELAELRRSVGDMKTAAATSRELSAAIAQLSQRVDKLDREQGAKLDRLGERVDRETTARAAELAARLDKLEKTPEPAPAAPPPAPAGPTPKFGANVSMDPTGSIERPKQVLHGYVVLGAQDDVALIGGRYGQRAVRPGDYLPGAGRVQRVERQGPDWVVVTEQGLIASAHAPPY